MHELSICQAIRATVDDRAAGRAVRRVDLRVGHLRQVVPDSLQLAWEMVTAGSALEGCDLAVEHVPAVVRCTTCGADTTLEWPVLACGACDGRAVTLLSGEELDIVSIDVVPAGDAAVG